MIKLLDGDMAGKATEGGDRLAQFRGVLVELINGKVGVAGAIQLVEIRLPRDGSAHAANNRVFPDGWAERLVRTQFSRLYSQAVLESLAATGQTRCFVAHSSEEDPNSPCSRSLAGQSHDVGAMLGVLVRSYVQGQFSKDPKVPDHPHCTHVVSPVRAPAA